MSSSSLSNSGIAAISLDFASTTTWPRLSRFAVAQAETMWIADFPDALSKLPRKVLPSIATTWPAVASWSSAIQPSRHFSKAAGSNAWKIALKRSCDGTPASRSRIVASQPRLSRPQVAMATKSSAPQITAQTAMVTTFTSGYVTLRRRGSTRFEKWSWRRTDRELRSDSGDGCDTGPPHYELTAS